MKPTDKMKKSGITINKKDKISSVAPKIISSNSIATVVDDSGEICGELTKDQIIDILFIDKENNA